MGTSFDDQARPRAHLLKQNKTKVLLHSFISTLTSTFESFRNLFPATFTTISNFDNVVNKYYVYANDFAFDKR